MIQLSAPLKTVNSSIHLGGSKSISNRLLILNALFDLKYEYPNLSQSEDSFLLKQALLQIKTRSSLQIDVNHAGTNMRFLSAFLSITPGEWLITGSERMKQRPIGVLVDALRLLGADISYPEKENYPPLLIKGKTLTGGKLSVESGISSQFISALLLIAPKLENGLELELLGKTVSAPYIGMTLSVLKELGVEIMEENTSIKVMPLSVNPKSSNIFIESDWSSASYFYSICALSKNSILQLKYLNKNSLQADAILPKLFSQLGVQTEFTNHGIRISSTTSKVSDFKYDCTNCPDIAQTLAVTCFGLGIACYLTGLSTLKIKESDRLFALKTELEKFNANVRVNHDSLSIQAMHHESIQNQKPITINTYNDHRMAMSFAALSLVFGKVQIDNADAVKKSYPIFWEDLKSLGFNVNLQP